GREAERRAEELVADRLGYRAHRDGDLPDGDRHADGNGQDDRRQKDERGPKAPRCANDRLRNQLIRPNDSMPWARASIPSMVRIVGFIACASIITKRLARTASRLLATGSVSRN